MRVSNFSRHPTSLIQQDDEECWVGVASVTWNIFRPRIQSKSDLEDSEVQCHSLWTIVIWIKTEKPKFYREIDFYWSAWSWNNMKTKALNSTGADIANSLYLNIVYIQYILQFIFNPYWGWKWPTLLQK